MADTTTPDTTTPDTKIPDTKVPDTMTLAAPAASTLTLSFTATKAFQFTWEAVTGATSYELQEAVTDGSGYTLVKETTATTFDHIVPLYARLKAKYILQSCNAVGCTASAAVFTSTRVNEMVTSIDYLKALNTGSDDYFGRSVSLSADGNTLAVGAPREDSSGAVYMFTHDGTAWEQQTRLKVTIRNANDEFGYSVSLSADGNTLAVGAPKEDSIGTGVDDRPANGAAEDAGAAYVFTRNASGMWSQQAYLKASNTDAGDLFGTSVSLSADGNILAVGAQDERSNAIGVNGDQDNNSTQVQGADAGAGAVYVFTRASKVWSPQPAYLKASNTDRNGEAFGVSVSLSADGNTLAVGAAYERSISNVINAGEDDNTLFKAGAVYVFTYNGTSWSYQAYLKASNAGESDYFGRSVSISRDGNTLAVGAWGEDSNAKGINNGKLNNDATSAGAAYVFIRSGVKWTEQAYLKASNTETNDRFGFSVSVSADGNTLAVSAFFEQSNAMGIEGEQDNNALNKAGAVYTYTRSAGTWYQQAYLKASNTGAGHQFGYSVALSSDGGTLAVGARNEGSSATGINKDPAVGGAIDSGAAYVY